MSMFDTGDVSVLAVLAVIMFSTAFMAAACFSDKSSFSFLPPDL